MLRRGGNTDDMAQSWAERVDRIAVDRARRYGITVLRVALGVVFVWFGALKVAGVSPVADLVADTLPFLPDRVAVLGMGIVEVLVGLGLITGKLIRLTLGVFFVQMLGTFLVLVMQPGDAFEGGNPLRLSVLGEFVLKNLVLIAAGIVVAAATIPRPEPGKGVGRMLAQSAEHDRPIPPPRDEPATSGAAQGRGRRSSPQR